MVPIVLPPLRDRSDDVPQLVTHFIEKYNKRLNKKIEGISDESLALLRQWPWPGNIRELRNVVELGWWESHQIGDLKITLVPAQHWSMRAPWDKNKRLWGGFVYESPEGTSYHAGDTAWSEGVFKAIGERFPKIDWAMLPIGAYDPTWFMSRQHMGPEEAGRAWELLGAKNFVAMHWGTFKLTDEPLGEPPERLRAWWAEQKHDPSRMWIVDLGETRALVAR